jgi:ribosome-binding ATPase
MIIGIVGKPNCGKSTFFKAATMADVLIANYPFATIKPNTGVGHVRTRDAGADLGRESTPRHGFRIGETRYVPVELIDVAGLVPGAHEGKGMGNQFLDDLRQADVLVHVIDLSGSTNAGGEPVEKLSYDPVNDVRFLEDELDHWYYGILRKGWEKFARQISHEGKVDIALAKQLSGLSVKEEHIKGALKHLALGPDPRTWTDEELFGLARDLRHATKPIVIAANKADVPGSLDNLERLRSTFPQLRIIPVSAESELALRSASKERLIDYAPGDSSFTVPEGSTLSDKQRQALSFIEEHVLRPLGSSGVQQVLDVAVFEELRYIAIYPGGVNNLEDSEGRVLPDCFLMPPGSTALDFAYRLHTDFGRGFIKAIDVRRRLPIGKDHPLSHGDVVEIHAKT